MVFAEHSTTTRFCIVIQHTHIYLEWGEIWKLFVVFCVYYHSLALNYNLKFTSEIIINRFITCVFRPHTFFKEWRSRKESLCCSKYNKPMSEDHRKSYFAPTSKKFYNMIVKMSVEAFNSSLKIAAN